MQPNGERPVDSESSRSPTTRWVYLIGGDFCLWHDDGLYYARENYPDSLIPFLLLQSEHGLSVASIDSFHRMLPSFTPIGAASYKSMRQHWPASNAQDVASDLVRNEIKMSVALATKSPVWSQFAASIEQVSEPKLRKTVRGTEKVGKTVSATVSSGTAISAAQLHG